VDSVFDHQQDTLSFVPQIQSDPDSVLIDTVNWMRIGGIYQAQGGEQFITIGNFFADNQITVLPLEGPAAFYYIDDVSVERCSQVGVSTNDLVAKQKTLNLFPNPASHSITVSGYAGNASIRIANATGQIVKSLTPQPNSQQAVIDVSDLPNGIYTVTYTQRLSGLTSQSKLVILH
jgi:hypothetical protein